MSAATVSPSHRGAVLLALPFFFFNDTATTEIYTLSLHDALPISLQAPRTGRGRAAKPGGGRGHAEAGAQAPPSPDGRRRQAPHGQPRLPRATLGARPGAAGSALLGGRAGGRGGGPERRGRGPGHGDRHRAGQGSQGTGRAAGDEGRG